MASWIGRFHSCNSCCPVSDICKFYNSFSIVLFCSRASVPRRYRSHKDFLRHRGTSYTFCRCHMGMDRCVPLLSMWRALLLTQIRFSHWGGQCDFSCPSCAPSLPLVPRCSVPSCLF